LVAKDRPIHIVRWGDTGPRVIMVHGSAQGSSVGGALHFSRQRNLSERGWQIIVPDRPGHGQSPAPGRPDDAEADGVWVAELLGSGAHLVGHSFGACVALAAAARRPDLVRSLTLIEPGMQKMATDDSNVRRFALQMILARILPMPPIFRAKRITKLLKIPSEIRGGSTAEELKKIGQGLARLKIPSKQTLQRELEIIKDKKIPLLVVTGGWSPVFEVTADRVASAGAGRRLVIASPHHFPQLVSDEFNLAVVQFMAQAEARTARA
jgi:pimeloyl-ACP methyl ester carboxylesterase